MKHEENKTVIYHRVVAHFECRQEAAALVFHVDFSESADQDHAV